MELPVRNRAGFTLIELLVALVISGILAGSIFQVIKGESEFVQMHSGREEVLQNSRGALELISSELRAVPPQGLEAATSNALTVRAPRVWGVVCAPPSSGNIDVAVPAIAGLSYSFSSGVRVAAFVKSDSVWTGPSGQITSMSAPSSSCGGQPLAPGTESRKMTVSTVPTTPAGTQPAVGDPIYLYDLVRYELGTSSRPGLWIRRKLGTGNFEPLAGPIAVDGLKFVYCCDASGNDLTATTALTAAQREVATRIDVIVEAESHSSLNGVVQTESDTAIVYLRNRG